MVEEKIIKSLNHEWECFYLDCMRTSKANIFAKSTEINKKKNIIIYLKRHLPEIGESAQKGLAVQDNIMESVYRYVVDYQGEAPEEELIKQFIAALGEGGHESK